MDIVCTVLEIRSRLKSVNAFVKFSKNPDECPSIILEDGVIRITVESSVINIPCTDFTIVTDSVSNIILSENVVVFRFSIENIDKNKGCFKTEVLINSAERGEFTNNKPLLQRNTNYLIQCLSCGRNISDVLKFKRVLPLPSVSASPGDWFCHTSNENFNFKMQSDEVFYSNCFVHLRMSNLPMIRERGRVFVCNHCLNWIGVKCDVNTMKIWHNTVKFINNTTVVQTCGLSDLFESIKNLFNFSNASIKLIVDCQSHPEKSDILLLWILEKKLQIFYKDLNHSKSYNVAKVLFKFVNTNDLIYKQWRGDSLVESISISKPMLMELLKHLHKFNNIFPKEFSMSNEFQISYLFLYNQFV